jgi:uncharacterized membrane protein
MQYVSVVTKEGAVMKTTILGGILFLAPLAIVAIILNKVFQMSIAVAKPLGKYMPLETYAGIASVNILAILLIVLVCYLAGLIAKRAFFSNRLQRLDGFLIDMIPGYAIFKGMVGSASSDEALAAMMTPVLVRFDDYEQIAFEIERGETHSVIFLPGSPSAWTGSSIVADNTRIRRLDIPTHQATKLLRAFGRGTLGVRAHRSARDAAQAETG